MALKKSELYSSLWQSCDALRGGMDASQYKDYVLSLKSTGTGACILPHGVLFRGNAEAEIRRNLVRKGYVKGIIGLPANLYYGTGIPACIVVVDKKDAAGRLSSSSGGIFMIDASDGFQKDGAKNRLGSQDIHKIVDVFNRQQEIAGYSKVVCFAEIEKNEFNLNLPRYIDSRQAEDIHDIAGHLQGGFRSPISIRWPRTGTSVRACGKACFATTVPATSIWRSTRPTSRRRFTNTRNSRRSLAR